MILLLDKIADRGAPVQRNRMASLLSKLFRFGIERGIVDTSPCVAIRALPAMSHRGWTSVLKADLVVMGTRGIGEFKGLLLGSVSHKMSARANCAVLTVK